MNSGTIWEIVWALIVLFLFGVPQEICECLCSVIGSFCRAEPLDRVFLLWIDAEDGPFVDGVYASREDACCAAGHLEDQYQGCWRIDYQPIMRGL